MVTAVYSTDLTLIDDAQAVGNFVATGGGGAALNDETDYFINGTQCVSKNGFTADEKGLMADDVSAPTITAGDAVFIWGRQANRNILNTVALGGGQVIMGTSNNAFDQFYVDGNDVEGSTLLSWVCYAVDPTATPSATTGSPGAFDHFGMQWNILGSGSLKGAPNAVGVIRYGRELQVTEGFTVSDGTFAGAASTDTTNRWGILIEVAGGYQFHGAFVMGTTATAVNFVDANRSISILDDAFVPAGFNEFEIRNASSVVSWTNILISHLGSSSPSVLTLDVGTFTGEACQFNGFDTTVFNSSSTCQATWTSCAAITAAGANLSGSSVLTPNITANTSGLIWNVATDPDGLLDDMSFTMGSTATHAIEFGTSSPTSITLRDIDFSGYSATDNQNDSTFDVKRTSGTVTINLVGCTGNFSARTAGATVNIVNNPVTIQVTCVDATGTAVSGVRVLLETAAAGAYPYQDPVTITQSAGTATVTHTSHGLATNDFAVISGANEAGYNGVNQITVTGTNSYTYSVDAGTASPATGTIISSYAPISAVTGGTGIVSTSKVFASDQAVSGVARKGTSTPLYKTAPISGTISSTSGLSQSAVMISDE